MPPYQEAKIEPKGPAALAFRDFTARRLQKSKGGDAEAKARTQLPSVPRFLLTVSAPHVGAAASCPHPSTDALQAGVSQAMSSKLLVDNEVEFEKNGVRLSTPGFIMCRAVNVKQPAAVREARRKRNPPENISLCPPPVV